jgi:vacuolar-type H+-ATPase subunit F/Vma7
MKLRRQSPGLDRGDETKSGFLLGVSLILTFLLFGCTTATTPVANSTSLPAEQAFQTVEEELGIEIIAMRQTAAGFMLDFRFRVLDPEKAMPLLREDIIPYLVDQTNGNKLAVTDSTKVGPMRPTSRNPREGIVYFMFFSNPGLSVKNGGKVTVVVGDHRLEDIVVQ